MDRPAVARASLLGSLLALAAALRWRATRNDLWLDEIVSLWTAKRIHSPWEIIASVHNDNNHYLNTLYLYLLGEQSDGASYRYLSVAFGIALVPAGYGLLARRSRAEGAILAGLLAFSYPLIHFSSEARGYSGALLGSTLACAALARWMAPDRSLSRRVGAGVAYSLAVVLAIASHLTACLVWLPLAAGSLVLALGRPERVQSVLGWIAINLPPAVVLMALYLLDLRHLAVLGGDPTAPGHGFGRLISLALGWPFQDEGSVWLLGAPLMVAFLWQLRELRREGDPLWALLGCLGLVGALCLLRLHVRFSPARYFLVFVPFFYALAAMLLARLLRRQWGPGALALVLMLYGAGQMSLYADFLSVGRGQFAAALKYMLDRTPELRLTSDQDFRSKMELGYLAGRVPGASQLAYSSINEAAETSPDWCIVHTEGRAPPGPESFQLPGQPSWVRVAYFGASELSGQAWTLYRH